MATSTVPVKSATTLFTLSAAVNSVISNGVTANVAGKFGGMLYVRMGRTASTSFATNLPVFKLLGSSGGTGTKDWVPIVAWSPALGAFNAVYQSLTATANSGATQVVVSAAPASCLSSDLFLYNTSAIARSEWNKIAVASVTTVLAVALERTQTAAKCLLITQAEQWAIPVDFSGVTHVMFQIDNSQFTVTTGIAVEAVLVATENLYQAP